MTTDGKYCSVSLLKQYLSLGRTDVSDPTKYNGAVQGTPDENILSNCILEAEAAFELEVGTGYDQQAYTLVQSFLAFVDGTGWLHLFARERGPVTTVSAVQVRDIATGAATWKDVAFTADNTILPPFQSSDTHPWAGSWHVRIWPTHPLPARSTGQILARWSYQGGFVAIPNALSMLICQASNYLYKLRESPMGTVTNMPLGTMTVPANMPPYIRRQFKLWSPSYA